MVSVCKEVDTFVPPSPMSLMTIPETWQQMIHNKNLTVSASNGHLKACDFLINSIIK